MSEKAASPMDAASVDAPQEARLPDCPCTADHCQVCGALDWRLDRVSGGEPWFWCARCGSPEGATKR